ncbi:MAG: ferredoxin [Desulfobulbus propionicus]|nr:MAG: ferredoxin [Desulfobulbus propionicus]
MVISIDIYLCSGCTGCVSLCPDIFQISPLTGKAELRRQEQPVTPCVREAAKLCPKKCIELSPVAENALSKALP